MRPAQYNEFHKYVPLIAHVWNTTPDTETGITPFQAEHGTPCRSIAERITSDGSRPEVDCNLSKRIYGAHQQRKGR